MNINSKRTSLTFCRKNFVVAAVERREPSNSSSGQSFSLKTKNSEDKVPVIHSRAESSSWFVDLYNFWGLFTGTRTYYKGDVN